MLEGEIDACKFFFSTATEGSYIDPTKLSCQNKSRTDCLKSTKSTSTMSSTTVLTPGTITREKNENGDPLYPDYMRKSI